MRNFQGVLLAIVLSLTAGRVDAFWRMTCSTIQVGRVDPIVNPNDISGHCHTIAGPNNLNTTSTYESLQASYCTSCSVQKDKSAYWTPNLYYRHINGTYEEVGHDGTVVYYLDRGVDVPNMKPFPPGFRMLSGDAAARSYDANTLAYNGNSSYPGLPISHRTTFLCIDSSGPMAETPGINRTDCDQGLRAQIHFQTCWDGVNLYKTDQSHVAYLSQIDNGVCPPGYPVLLPHLFFEVLYSVNNIDQTGGGMFVFSQGDTTGYGFHGDFLNGWDTDILVDAISQCMGPTSDPFGVISLCPPLQASNDPYFEQNCPEQAPVVNETVHGLLNVLPGCNPPTGGPIRATQNICPVQPGLNYIPNQDYKSRAVAKPGDKVGNWQYQGCALDPGNPRPVGDVTWVSLTNITIETCTAYCKQNGYFYAGLEYSSQCYCGGTLQQPILSPLNCSQQSYMTCSGSTLEYCGGSSLMQIWNDTSYAGQPPQGIPVVNQTTMTVPNNGGIATYKGCYVDPQLDRALKGPNFSNDTGMTLEMCSAFCAQSQAAYFGTEYSQECYCGNSTAAAASAPQSDCAMSCQGDKSELCGGGSRLSIWGLDNFAGNIGSATVTAGGSPGDGNSGGGSPPPSGSTGPIPSASPTTPNIAPLGCYGETTPTRALTPIFTYTASMTIDDCAQLAQAQNLQYFGLEYASQCFAGNVLNSSSAPIPSSSCNMGCVGDTTQNCGGSNALNLYNNTQWIKPTNPNPVNVPNQPGTQYSYMGCYTEGTSGAYALGSTSSGGSAATPPTNTLTVEACAAYCFSKGYNWMGVENGDMCYCNADGPINGATSALETDCNVACAGNNTENCGASGRLNVYQRNPGGSMRFARRVAEARKERMATAAKRGSRFKLW
ncbi:hypothetical protein H2200_003892 [Cladophialophora chaetospira]|uniref:WSC domain-containing protein n=1 Tax=Cladophialophora chaetospira TaxID=386627 RepID=A0AA38XF28_9EURO|nr:hypothetical protein H2200_003892 [Cladophialophora chaetospira]